MSTELVLTIEERCEIQELMFDLIPHLYQDLDQAPGIIVVKRTYPADDGGAVDIVIPVVFKEHVVYVAALLQYSCSVFSRGDVDLYKGDEFTSLEDAVAFWKPSIR